MINGKDILVAIVFWLFISASSCYGQNYGNYDACDTIVSISNHETSISVTQDSKGSTQNVSLYDLPYSITKKCYDWKRLCINTATLSGAFVGTLLVLECLPEDATSWNRAELQDVPLFKRWHKHVIEKGPEWDHDKFYFNYILHPYAGCRLLYGRPQLWIQCMAIITL